MRLVWIASVSLLLIGATASAQINPFGNNPRRFSATDRAAMYASMRTVLEQQEVGATAEWAGEDGEIGGVSDLVRVFERDGMRCGEVVHRFRDLDESDRLLPEITQFTATACEVPGEGWKLAF